MTRKKPSEGEGQATEIGETRLQMLIRLRDGVEKVLHNPIGVSATELTEFRNNMNAEIDELTQDEPVVEENVGHGG